MDYKQKYLKYKRKYIKLKGSSIRNGNEDVNEDPNYDMNNFNLDAIIQNVLNINEAELNRRRAILRNANFGPNIPDPLNRPDRPPDPRERLRRGLMNLIREDVEDADDETKRFLLDNYTSVNYLRDHPPSWWPFNR